MIDHYCCFVCADQNKTEERSLDQSCNSCGRNYGFPLQDYPQIINGFEVIKPLSRGYYSVAYKVKHPKFTNKVSVLKVIPKLVYENHGKNFEVECQKHNEIASNSDHIVKIQDFFEAKLNFGTCELDSYIAELEFVDGFPLEKVIDGEEILTAPECTQVALDLFHILFDLKRMEVRHNDLHGGNVIVQRLNESQFRLGAVEPRIRVKAIDINSASGSGEDYLPDRPRDIQRVAGLVRRICQRLLENPDSVDDLHFRALTKLVDLSYLLDTNTNDSRAIEFEEIIRIIKTEYDESQYAQSAPWKRKFTLTAINDYYNAQALEPWFASHLFVDPENKWLTSINSPGPQLITGMRGCGKTILLKSLQFHASANNSDDLDNNQIIERLKNDGYVGLYVSSSRLIDAMEEDDYIEAFSILFIAFTSCAT
jgi:serine/threonine protein kinase